MKLVHLVNVIFFFLYVETKDEIAVNVKICHKTFIIVLSN